MNRVKKLSIAIIAGICSVLIILSAAVLVSPWLLDKTSLKETVCSEVSRLIGGEFRYSETTLSLFPSPHVVLVNPQIDIPDTLSASVDTVEVYPELVKLFAGRFVLNKTTINRPKATIWIPESTADPKKHSGPVEFSRLMPTLLHSLSRLPKPVFAIDNGIVSKGSVSLIYNKTTTVTFDSIDAEIQNRSDTLGIKITSRSNMFDNLLVTGSFQTGTRNGNAHIELDKLKLDALSDGFFPDNPVKIVDGETTVGIDITVQDNEDIDLTLKGSAPALHLEKGKQNVALEIQTIAARININSTSTTIDVSELTVGTPSMQLSGSLSLSDQSPKLKVQLQGHTIDIKTVRSASLALAGSDSVTQTIFEIVKGGTIPLLTISSQADTMGDLADLDNLVLQTSLANSTIDVPGTRLELTEVSGGLNITKGVLAAEHVLAQRQKTTVKNGIVKINLSKDPLPLDITADVHVDVSAIPAILADVTNDQRLNDEFKKVKDLTGSVKASLSLSGSTDNLEIKVSATDINAAGRYNTIPFPLTIDSGGLTYEETGITWNKLKGSVGSSSFSAFSGSLDFAKTKNFEITSGSSDIVLAELLPWIAQQQKKTEIIDYYGGGTGILQLSEIKAEGPANDVRKWHFDITGKLEELIIKNLPKEPGPVKIDSLRFHVDSKAITYSIDRLSLLDTRLTMSGSLEQYMEGIDADTHLVVDGTVGAETTGWFAKGFNMPPWLRIQPLQLTRSELTYSNHSGQQISAALGLQKNLKVLAKVTIEPNELIIENLSIKDHVSQVALGGTYKDPMLTISYDGNLQASTLKQLLQFDQAPGTAELDGKAQIRLNLKKASETSLVGKLSGKNFSLPTAFKEPLHIKYIAIDGTSETVSVKSADLSWNDIALSLSGSITPDFPDKAMIDLAVDADSVDVEKILATIKRSRTVQDNKKTRTFSIPVAGIVHFRAKNVEIKDRTIQPLQADIQFQDENATFTIKDTGLCGIMTAGTITLTPDRIHFDLRPEAQGQQIGATLDCLTDKKFKADGTFDLKGRLEGHGTLDELIGSTSGSFDISTSNGRLYRDIVLLNVLKFLNAAEVLTGRISPDKMLEKGVGFKRFGAQVKLQKGKLEYDSFIFDGDEIKLSGTGDIDLVSRELKFTLLVTTQKTASTLLGYVPLVGGVLQTIATIPLTVGGTIDDIHVLPLAPSAVGHELKELTEQTLGIPLRLVHLHDFHPTEIGD